MLPGGMFSSDVRTVPTPNDFVLVLVSENAYRCRIQREQFSVGCGEFEPHGGKNAQHVSMREEGNIAVRLNASIDDALHPHSDAFD